LRLTIDRPGPLVVAVEGPATLESVVARRGVKPFAFTNPIWIVEEGKAAEVDLADAPIVSTGPRAADAGDDADVASAPTTHVH
jgi:hypothetical protein